MNIETLQIILDKIESADGPSVPLDYDIGRIDPQQGVQGWPRYSASIDESVALVNRVLPGWLWRVMSCSVSDDAFVMPDFNDPVHGERLRREWPDECQRDPLAYLGTDIDRRPSGNPALALLEAMLRGLIAIEKEKAK